MAEGAALYDVALERPDDLDGFRKAARGLIALEVPPRQVLWHASGEGSLFGASLLPEGGPFPVPAAFVPLAADVVCHRDGERFALLYEALWRIRHGEKRLLHVVADPLVHRLAMLRKAVGRDVHKMHAFVRFRRLETEAGERFAAWFEPEHHILRRVASFFTGRFSTMNWSILTPEGAMHWNGAELSFGPGVRKEDAPEGDDFEDWWRTYYRATFNPARSNPDMMRQEMPKKYWRNLPEAELIPSLLAEAGNRTAGMLERAPEAPRKRIAPYVPAAPAILPAGSLAEIRQDASSCVRCPLFGPATQTVFGEGPLDAPVVFVGEQPGDQEDLAGRPFVGPAGQLFDRALQEAGLDRRQAYVTNAVKHFKFEPRGKRRIHKKPEGREIEACRWWLDRELATLKPSLVVALGATAARSLTGRTVSVLRERGRITEMRPGLPGLLTVHPSFLLRLPDPAARETEYRRFVEDLRHIGEIAPVMRLAA
ncbi:DNA polymerase [Faunimonas pinastri]|uniref:Type-4 uracil-DNA glycosylase n=1 Tax=Faunimonas pinastri TaxID=1855383 RepID=A0A1H9M352_9HYPH|nr:UdgX family uracil-DNA binding protein [Faunimonas pinastri]SER17959.1 DNA polymerase [Faunimonas pinastri]